LRVYQRRKISLWVEGGLAVREAEGLSNWRGSAETGQRSAPFGAERELN